MERQDYLKKQIDLLGKILGKILSDLLGLKNSGNINQGLEITNQTLKAELDFDIQDLLDIPTDQWIETLIKQKNISNNNLEKLAEILLLIADNQRDNNKNLYEKCLTIYQYLETTETVYTLDRQWKITHIKNELSSL
ncbi:MAG TPA: hypothetical protein VKZ44_07275 [Taishania sp.]|nr:hypothetical protein [Taishania sp.]